MVGILLLALLRQVAIGLCTIISKLSNISPIVKCHTWMPCSRQ